MAFQFASSSPVEQPFYIIICLENNLRRTLLNKTNGPNPGLWFLKYLPTSPRKATEANNSILAALDQQLTFRSKLLWNVEV